MFYKEKDIILDNCDENGENIIPFERSCSPLLPLSVDVTVRTQIIPFSFHLLSSPCLLFSLMR